MFDMTTYGAFFDELGLIEKRAMLKEAANPMGGANLARTGLMMLRRPGQAAETLGKIWQSGVKSAPKGADWVTRTGKGVGALWNTPGGRAAVLGGGALGLGGLGTAAYMVGRGRSNQPSVYMNS